MTSPARAIVGPVYAAVEAVLQGQPGYAQCRIERFDQQGWEALVDRAADALLAAGLPGADLKFMKRIPPDRDGLVQRILEDLKRRQLVSGRVPEAVEGPPAYDHGGYRTFIYPEEGQLLGAIASAARPRRAAFLGSYYGYWASFAIPHIVNGGGRVVLVDPDPAVGAVARRNVVRLAHEHAVEVITSTGEDYARRTDQVFDLVVIDAELPRDHPVPELRGKGVYRSLLEAILPRLSDDCLLVCHNILVSDWTGDPGFSAVIERNHEELGPFLALAAQHFDFVEYGTTEGVGVGRRRGRAT